MRSEISSELLNSIQLLIIYAYPKIRKKDIVITQYKWGLLLKLSRFISKKEVDLQMYSLFHSQGLDRSDFKISIEFEDRDGLLYDKSFYQAILGRGSYVVMKNIANYYIKNRSYRKDGQSKSEFVYLCKKKVLDKKELITHLRTKQFLRNDELSEFLDFLFGVHFFNSDVKHIDVSVI